MTMPSRRQAQAPAPAHALTPPPPLPRREWPRWTYCPARVLVVVVLWPVLKVLEWLGRWPQAIGRGLNRRMRAAAPLEPAGNDVVIGSYFKSGTNWTMQMAVQIAHHGAAEFEHIHDVVPWFELPAKPPYAVPIDEPRVRAGADRGLRIIKTHLALDALGYSPNGLYIWVVRDPKDVLVSSYHFVRRIMLGPLMPSLERWLDLYLSPDAPIGSWAAHVKGGWEHRHRDNFLLLTYEEIKAAHADAIERMAALMGVDLSSAERAEVLKRSSFDYMKSISYKFDTVGMSPPWVRPRGAMIRRGPHGSAAELLSAEDQARIDDYWRSELVRTGCDFPYDELYGAGRSAVQSSESR